MSSAAKSVPGELLLSDFLTMKTTALTLHTLGYKTVSLNITETNKLNKANSRKTRLHRGVITVGGWLRGAYRNIVIVSRVVLLTLSG